MNDSIPPLLTLESDVKAKLEQQSKPLLLNFTASWCQPCKALLPVLGSVMSKHGTVIDVVRVDVDACRDLARQHGVRGVPTSILFRDGTERDRFIGVKAESALVRWLVALDIKLVATPEHDDARVSFGAFHGDDSLKQLLVERLYQHMDQGDVQVSLFPVLAGGKGSVSCLLVHHASPDVFECITGLPYAFGCALEFLRATARADIEEIFQALAPGQDVREAPLRLIHAWLSADSLGWGPALGSSLHDTLRRDWLSLTSELLDGSDLDAQRWTALREAATALTTPDSDPYHQLEDDLAALVTIMSPPPDVRDIHAWRAILARAGFAMSRLAEFAEGWTKEDSAKPVLRERYFRKHAPIGADGRPDRDIYAAKLAEWKRDNADFVVLEREFTSARRSQKWVELHAEFRSILAAILRND